MLDILGGIRSPTQGVVLLEDELGRALSTAQHARSCAWILQSNLVLGRRTVLDNVTIGALAQGVPAREARDRARAALDLLGIAPHAQVPVDRLSGGEQQRVTVARCIASPSAVLLADEPTGSLDAFNTGLVVECLQRAAASNQIVFVATHDDAVKSGCARVLDLSEASE